MTVKSMLGRVPEENYWYFWGLEMEDSLDDKEYSHSDSNSDLDKLGTFGGSH